jgi:hypothetical protein
LRSRGNAGAGIEWSQDRGREKRAEKQEGRGLGCWLRPGLERVGEKRRAMEDSERVAESQAELESECLKAGG